MPNQEELEAMFGQSYKDFGNVSNVVESGLQVVYALASQKFPIGYIGDKNTPADLGRKVVDNTLGNKFGLIHHVQLAPHATHNKVEVLPNVAVMKDLLDGISESYVCDGLIIPRAGEPFVIETFLGDCACIVVWSKEWVGYMHVGRPEVMEEPSVIENFLNYWPSKPENTRVWVGPCIQGNHYELPSISEKFQKYKTETIWETQGFDLYGAISDQICSSDKIEDVRERVNSVHIDPFVECMSGNYSWAASDQWYRRKGKELGFPIYSPRNSAMLFVNG